MSLPPSTHLHKKLGISWESLLGGLENTTSNQAHFSVSIAILPHRRPWYLQHMCLYIIHCTSRSWDSLSNLLMKTYLPSIIDVHVAPHSMDIVHASLRDETLPTYWYPPQGISPNLLCSFLLRPYLYQCGIDMVFWVKCKLWSLTPWLRFTFTFYKI